MHLVIERLTTDDWNDAILPPSLRDIYFLRLKSLELACVDVELAEFPNLEMLYWRSSWDVWGGVQDPLDRTIEHLKCGGNFESVLPQLTGDRDAALVELWMREIIKLNDQIIAAAEAGQDTLDTDVDAHKMLFRAMRAKDRTYRVTTKADTNILLTSTASDGIEQSMSLVLVCSRSITR